MAPKRIFLIQTAFLGDVILSTNLPRAIKRIYPEAELDLVLIPSTRAIFAHDLHVNRIWVFDKGRFPRKVISFFQLVKNLRRRRYGLAISLHVSLTSSLIMLLSGAKERLGYPRQRHTTMSVDLPKGIPVVKRGLLLLKALSDEEFDHQTELFVPPGTQARVENFLAANSLKPEKLVALAPGSVRATKRWLPQYYAQVLKDLEGKGYKTVLVGGKQDKQLCERIIRDAKTRTVNAAGKFDILGSAWLIRNCRLLISNDSAPLHLANAVRTPVLAIFGPTVKRFGFFPFRGCDRVLQIDLDCRPCGKHGHRRCPRGHFKCMALISPEQVVNTALEMLQ
ncbi:MAG: lipopolysaccharide heptosyltransferase II [Candidatus Syntrophosphaera sp.]